MLNLPYYNIDLEKEYQYSYLLHILIRITWLVKNNKITKIDFLSACKDNGISGRSAYRYWEKWAYKNKFIKFVSQDKESLYLTSKDNFDIVEKVPSSIYENIKTITDLKDFLHLARLGRVWVKNKLIKTGKWLNKIARETNTCLSTVFYRNKRASKKFWLEIQKRFGVFNNTLIRLTNVYFSSVRIIRNKYCAVNNSIRERLKTINNDHFAPLFKANNTKITSKLRYAHKEDYEMINNALYPNLI